jgi:hypothetical protein
VSWYIKVASHPTVNLTHHQHNGTNYHLTLPSMRILTSSSRPLFSPTTRLFTRAMSSTPRFASGTDAEALTPTVTSLLSTSGGRWTLAAEGEALERSFKFKTFAKTWVRFPIVYVYTSVKGLF